MNGWIDSIGVNLSKGKDTKARRHICASCFSRRFPSGFDHSASLYNTGVSIPPQGLPKIVSTQCYFVHFLPLPLGQRVQVTVSGTVRCPLVFTHRVVSNACFYISSTHSVPMVCSSTRLGVQIEEYRSYQT